nr:MAG TPA_asm: hypothetical protein [Caudoviricetes sp.]
MAMLSATRNELRRCVRCGRLLHYWHIITTSDEEYGCACVDERSCHSRQRTRKQKKLLELQKRWAK